MIAVDELTGTTKYFEFGRYESDDGQVEQRVVPDVVIGPDGTPTSASVQNLMAYISSHYGKGGRADLQYNPQVKYQAIVDFAHQRMRHHAPYSWNPFHMNTCKTFASEAVHQ